MSATAWGAAAMPVGSHTDDRLPSHSIVLPMEDPRPKDSHILHRMAKYAAGDQAMCR